MSLNKIVEIILKGLGACAAFDILLIVAMSIGRWHVNRPLRRAAKRRHQYTS